MMKFIDILSSELPGIDASVKECVNLGQWMLFRAEKTDLFDINVFFFLKVGKDLFALDEKGEVLTVFHPVRKDITINEVIYFSDLPKPQSLSNMIISGAAMTW